MRSPLQPTAPPSVPMPREGQHARPTPSRRPAPAAAPDWLGLVFSRSRPNELRLRVVGEVDLLTAPSLAHALSSAIRTVSVDHPDSVRQRVVCDLDEVTFFGATGLHTLVQADVDATDHDIDLVIVATGGSPRRCLSLVALDRSLIVIDRAGLTH